MNKFSRQNVTTLSAEFIEALQDVANKHGVTITPSGSRYSDFSVTFKIEATIENEAALEDKAVYVNQIGNQLGSMVEIFGKEFTSNGQQFKIVDVAPRSPKYPLIGERLSDGKSFKFQRSVIAKLNSEVL